MTVARLLTLLRPRSVLSRAVAAWNAGRYDPGLDALVDLSGNGHHARFGSTVGADTNDPLRLDWDGQNYLYLPGTSGNSLTVTNPEAHTWWTATFLGDDPVDGDSTDGTLAFGGTEVDFAGKRLTTLTLYADSGRTVQVGRFAAALSTEPHVGYTDADGNAWTINRGSSGRLSALVDRNLLLFGGDDYLNVAHDTDLNVPNGGARAFTVVVASRWHTSAPIIGKLDMPFATSKPGWSMYNQARFRLRDDAANTGTVIATTPSPVPSLNLLAATVAGNTLAIYLDAVSQGTSSASNVENTAGSTYPLLIGMHNSGPVYSLMEFVGAAIFREALSASDLEAVGAAFGVTA